MEEEMPDQDVDNLFRVFGIEDAPLANHGPQIGVTPVQVLTPEEQAAQDARLAARDEFETRHSAAWAEHRRRGYRAQR
jgi:hypothetical protein